MSSNPTKFFKSCVAKKVLLVDTMHIRKNLDMNNSKHWYKFPLFLKTKSKI